MIDLVPFVQHKCADNDMRNEAYSWCSCRWLRHRKWHGPLECWNIPFCPVLKTDWDHVPNEAWHRGHGLLEGKTIVGPSEAVAQRPVSVTLKAHQLSLQLCSGCSQRHGNRTWSFFFCRCIRHGDGTTHWKLNNSWSSTLERAVGRDQINSLVSGKLRSVDGHHGAIARWTMRDVASLFDVSLCALVSPKDCIQVLLVVLTQHSVSTVMKTTQISVTGLLTTIFGNDLDHVILAIRGDTEG